MFIFENMVVFVHPFSITEGVKLLCLKFIDGSWATYM